MGVFIMFYCILHRGIRDNNSTVPTIKYQMCCIKNTALWLQIQYTVNLTTTIVFPCIYMDSYNFMHRFPTLPTTLNGTAYHYASYTVSYSFIVM